MQPMDGLLAMLVGDGCVCAVVTNEFINQCERPPFDKTD